MKKMLHERIYELVNDMDRSAFDELEAEYGVNGERDLFRKIADEIIETYYPRPRYGDGTVVPFGTSDIEWDHGSVCAYNAIEVYLGQPIAITNNDVCAQAVMKDGFVQRGKRAFGEDGIELVAGENVYTVEGREKGQIKEVMADGKVLVDFEGFVTKMDGSKLTHEPDNIGVILTDMARFAKESNAELDDIVTKWINRIEDAW